MCFETKLTIEILIYKYATSPLGQHPIKYRLYYKLLQSTLLIITSY